MYIWFDNNRLWWGDQRSSQYLVVLTLICCGYGLTTGTPNNQLAYWTAVSHHAKPTFSHSSARNTCQFRMSKCVKWVEGPKSPAESTSFLAWCFDVNYHQKLVSTKNRIHQHGQNMTTNVSKFHIGEPVMPHIKIVTHRFGCQPSKEFLSSILSSSWFQVTPGWTPNKMSQHRTVLSSETKIPRGK